MEAPNRQPLSSQDALLGRLQARDEAAFELLVREQGGRMLRVASRLLGSDDEARDAVQEAFLSAYRSIGRFAGDSQLSTWLHRIVVNAALMRLRRPARRRECAIDDLLPRFLPDGHRIEAEPEAPAEHADDRAVRRDVQRVVRQAIDRLPEIYRTVLLLRDIEELTGQEAADLLGITPNAVKIRLHRARQALREQLDGQLRGREEWPPS